MVRAFPSGVAGSSEAFGKISGFTEDPKIYLNAPGSNWFVYIYGVNTNQIVETSLGYFINPLFNFLLGVIFLKERLNYWESLALGMAALGVLNFLWNFDSLPWIALSLAFTFSFYGLLRKMIPVKSLVGLLMETVLLSPFAAVMIVVWNLDGTGNMGGDW